MYIVLIIIISVLILIRSLTAIYSESFVSKNRDIFFTILTILIISTSPFSLSVLERDIRADLRDEILIENPNISLPFWVNLERDYAIIDKSVANEKILILGSSVSFDAVSPSCMEQNLSNQEVNYEVFNLAYPGDHLLYRLVDIEYISNSDVGTVMIEASPATLRNYYPELNAEWRARFSERIFLNDADISEIIKANSKLESQLLEIGLKTHSDDLISEFTYKYLEGTLSSLLGPQKNKMNLGWHNPKSNGSLELVDMVRSDDYSSKLEEALLTNLSIKFNDEEINGEEIWDMAEIEYGNLNFNALNLIVEKIINMGKKVIILVYPQHPLIDDIINYSDSFTQDVSDSLKPNGAQVSIQNFENFENFNHYWSDVKHVNSVGKSALCTYFSSSIKSE